jgi:hypothetical protein
MSSDYAKPRATAPPRLDWQGELDSALADIDTRLTHPRRRASDSHRPPVLPELGQVKVTTEMLDEIAWRVAEQIRRRGETVAPQALTAALTEPMPAETPAAPPPQRQTAPRPAAAAPAIDRRSPPIALAPGKMVLIRYRMPVLPWPLRLLQRRRSDKQPPFTTARA